VTISRAQANLTFPASFTLVAAQNPCPCGFSSDPDRECVCTQFQLRRYHNRISGPLLDRIDLHIEVPRLEFSKIVSPEPSESSAIIVERVEKALTHAYTGRKDKKGDFRSLWITRINAACRDESLSYSRFMAGLKKAGITLNRKMLAEMALRDAESLKKIISLSRKA